MKLLLVTERFPARSETFIFRKAVALARRGHEVTVATRRRGDWSLYPDALPPTLRVEVMPPDDALRDPRHLAAASVGVLAAIRRDVAGARALLARCRAAARGPEAYRLFIRHVPLLARDVDVAHFEFLSLGAMYPLARATLARPVVVSCRGNDVHTLELRPAAERAAALACLGAADAVHCVSEEMAGEVRRLSGRTQGLWVNRPAVDTDAIRARPLESYTGPLRVLATGRLVWKKGFDYLLAAFAHLARRGVDFRAEILGDGELKNVLRYSIHDLGLTDHVRLAGGVTSREVLERMQQTDVFVLSSLEEGISNAALEAMATGIPVVTTTAGGMAEAVTDGSEGFVVGVRDAHALADRIERLARDPGLRARMGRAARARAAADFTLSRQVSVFEALYRSITEVV